MRYIMLDTETTGLDPKTGHRILEIGLVEVLDRNITKRYFHHYLNPERDIPPESIVIHGITEEKVQNAPVFAQIVDDLFTFIEDAPLVIHNANFDLAFLDAECQRLGIGSFREKITGVIDTLELAKKMFPGSRKSLDSLCERFGISLSERTLHGALLDAQLLASVYLAMTRGQSSLAMSEETQPSLSTQHRTISPIQVVRYASSEEQAKHDAYFA
jgi:DNA polymerase-3 subunit epsilon